MNHKIIMLNEGSQEKTHILYNSINIKSYSNLIQKISGYLRMRGRRGWERKRYLKVKIDHIIQFLYHLLYA